MNMLEAAKETLSRIKPDGFYDNTGPTGTDYGHLQEMVTKMETIEMSPSKMGRWLGWLQCAVVCFSAGQVTLEDCKQINMKWAD